MISLPTAILLTGILVGTGLAVGLVFGAYFLYRLLLTIAVLRGASDGAEAAKILRAASRAPVHPQAPSLTVADIPPVGVEALRDSKEAMMTLRKKQNPSPDSY